MCMKVAIDLYGISVNLFRLSSDVPEGHITVGI